MQIKLYLGQNEGTMRGLATRLSFFRREGRQRGFRAIRDAHHRDDGTMGTLWLLSGGALHKTRSIET